MEDVISVFSFKNLTLKATELPNFIRCEDRMYKLIFSNGIIATYQQEGKFSNPNKWKNIPLREK